MATDVTIDSAVQRRASLPRLPDTLSLLRMAADPLRAAILQALASEQLCVCHLQDVLGARQTLVSHHLKALRDAGLVETEPSGRYTYYRLTPGALDEVAAALGRVAAATHADMPKRPC